MRLRAMGGLSLAGSSFRRPKPLLLLTFLALEGPKDRRYIAELFWPTAADRRQSLSVALSQLRNAAPNALGQDGVMLEADVDCDAAGLLRAAAERAWPIVADLYRGSFLAGVDSADGNVELEEWLYLTRETLAVRAQQAFVELAEESAKNGDLRTSARFADRAAALHPDANGAGPRLLSRLHALLVLNNDPRAQPLRREAAEVGIELPEAVPGTGAGKAKRLTVSNLPRTYLPFVGRERELSELENLLRSGTRLMTVTGLGGYGKTRLAIEVSRRLLERGDHDDIYFVQMEGATDPRDALERISAAVQLQPTGGTPLEALQERFTGRAALLVLDNVELLPSAFADLLPLLEARPGLAMLVTSREPLGLYAETVYPLAGMSLPAPEDDPLSDASLSDGLELFTLTARRSDPRFHLEQTNLPPILDICRRVAGAPLGIELAASLVRVMPPEELARALEDDLDSLVATQPQHPQRHANLRTLFEHSWSKLSLEQRSALAGASAFDGGFTRAAALRLLGMDVALLAELLDRSLITRQGLRYDLHPLVRQYAAEKLGEEPTARGVRLAHAEHYTELLAGKGAFHRRIGQRVAFQELDREYANIRAAWLWAVAEGQHELLSRMVMTLPEYLVVRSRTSESTALVDAALARVQQGSELASRLLLAKAKLLMDESPDEAGALLLEALDISQAFGVDDLTALIENTMGRVLLAAGDERGAHDSWSRALPALKQVDGGMYYGGCLSNLSLVTVDRSTHEELLLAALEASRRSGNALDQVNILNNLACHQRMSDGDFAGALESVRAAIALESREIDRRRTLMNLNEWAAYYQVQLGEYAGARQHLAEVEALLAQREPWEEDVGAELRTSWVRAQQHLALGELERTVHYATQAGYDAPSLIFLAWHAAIRGDVAEARRHRETLDRAAHAPFSRPSLSLRGVVHLLDGALALQTADDPRGAELGPRTMAASELLHALKVATEYECVPTALWAFAALPLLAPDHAEPELLTLAVTHPAAGVSTCWLAGSLQRTQGDLGAPLARAAPDAGPGPLGRTEVLALAARLADRLRGSPQFAGAD